MRLPRRFALIFDPRLVHLLAKIRGRRHRKQALEARVCRALQDRHAAAHAHAGKRNVRRVRLRQPADIAHGGAGVLQPLRAAQKAPAALAVRPARVKLQREVAVSAQLRRHAVVHFLIGGVAVVEHDGGRGRGAVGQAERCGQRRVAGEDADVSDLHRCLLKYFR